MNQNLKNKVLTLLRQAPESKRDNFGLIAVAVFLILLGCFPRFMGSVFITLLILKQVYELILHITKLYPAVSRRIVRRSWRFVIAARQYYKISEVMDFLYTLTLLLALGPFIYFVFTKNNDAASLTISVILVLLGVAAVFDLYSRITWLMKKTWAKVFGKAVLAGLGAALIFVSATIAKRTSSELNQADPQYFTEFVGLLTSLYTPILLGAVLIGIVVLIAFLELISSSVFITLSIFMSHVTFWIQGPKKKAKTKSFNKGGSRQGSAKWKEAVYIMRPISLMIVVYAITSFGTTVYYRFSKNIQWVEKHVLVYMHYQSNNECTNLDKKTLIAKLGDNMVSVANVSSDVIFTTQKCER